MQSNWNEHWVQESTKEYWQEPAAEVVNLIKAYSPQNQPDALDLGCGIGRHAIALAKAGFNVTALDGSVEALERLKRRIANLKLEMTIKQGSYLEQLFNPSSFDIIVAYNVIYHGSRQDFALALARCKEYLKPGGILFFTCPTRDDGKYDSGTAVSLHTYASLNSVHPGDVHYFADENDIKEFLDGTHVESLSRNEHYWDNEGVKQFSSYWQVVATKPVDSL